MKKTILTLAAAVLLLPVFAQGTDILIAAQSAATDTVTVSVSDEKVIVVETTDDGSRTEVVTYKKSHHFKKDRVTWNFMFDIGMNDYGKRNLFTGSEGDDDFLGLDSKSVNVAVYPWLGVVALNSERSLRLTTGIGFDWGNYRFKQGWSIADVDDNTVPSNQYRTPGGENLVSKSKLMTVYLNVPLMLRWDIRLSSAGLDRIYFSAGVIGGLKLGSHTKVKYNEGGKHKEHDSYNLNMLRYDLTFRAGYGPVGVYFNYQMTPMFESGHGPKLYPYAVGLSFGF